MKRIIAEAVLAFFVAVALMLVAFGMSTPVGAQHYILTWIVVTAIIGSLAGIITFLVRYLVMVYDEAEASARDNVTPLNRRVS